jgi:hypothetical protein
VNEQTIIAFPRQERQANCAVCGAWPEADRETMRLLIDAIPPKGWVCEKCAVSFWINCWPPKPKRRRAKAD